MSGSSLFTTIADYRASFTPAQHRIADFLVQNPFKSAFLNARELAAAVNTSESSITRFAYSLGFDGYPALQEAAKNLISSQLAMDERYRTRRSVDDIVETVVANATHNVQDLTRALSEAEIERAGALLAAARTCYVVGFRGSAGLALIASGTLHEVGRSCVQLSIETGEAIDQLIPAGLGDVLLLFVYGRYARRTLQIARFAHERGMRVIAVADSYLGALPQWADIILVGHVEAPHSSYSLISLLAILDALILSFSKQRGEAAVASIEAWERTYSFFDYLDSPLA